MAPTVSFTPSPVAFAENSIIMVLTSAVKKGLSSWSFPVNNRVALTRLQERGLIQVELAPNGKAYKATLTEDGRSELGV